MVKESVKLILNRLRFRGVATFKEFYDVGLKPKEWENILHFLGKSIRHDLGDSCAKSRRSRFVRGGWEAADSFGERYSWNMSASDRKAYHNKRWSPSRTGEHP